MTAILIAGVIFIGGIGTISNATEADLSIPEVRTIALPIAENRDTGATIADGYIYYLGQKGAVYSAPLLILRRQSRFFNCRRETIILTMDFPLHG